MVPAKSKQNQVLIIAAHPDDEILGAGATMAKHSAAGDDVHVIIVAEGATSRYSSSKSRSSRAVVEVNELRACAQAAAKVLGTREPRFLEFPDNKLDSIPLLDVVHKIEAVIKEVLPNIVYTHHGSDLNIDHQVVHRAVLTATRPMPGTSVQAIYTFETVSSTEWFSPQQQFPFMPNRFVNVTNFFDKKLLALSQYEREMRPYPHARSVEAVEALARVRGAANGMEMVEAFTVIRELID